MFYMDLFHSEIRLPDGFVAPTARVRLLWTKHADRARRDDRYGMIPRFETATLGNLRVIEVGMENGRIAKILFRGQMNADLDVCMVLMPTTRTSWTVKTVWINERNDSHKTLDRSKYVR